MKLYTFPFLSSSFSWSCMFLVWNDLAGEDVSVPVLLLSIAHYSSLHRAQSSPGSIHWSSLFQTNKGHLCKSISSFTLGLSAPYIRPYDYIIHIAALCISLITSFQLPLVWIQAGRVPHLASFPDLPTIQFLIACSMRSKTGRWKGLGTRLVLIIQSLHKTTWLKVHGYWSFRVHWTGV